MALLSIENLRAGYGAIRVLHDVSLRVEPGEIVTLIGANGAGKSTVLRTLSGLIRPQSGTIYYDGRNIAGIEPHKIARLGISHVPEGRGIFGNLTVTENLLLASFARKKHAPKDHLLKMAFDLFPELRSRQSQIAATLSGGEQQMLAMGRAVAADGDMLVLDEPSMGLSPALVKRVFAIIQEIHKAGKTVLLVEQNAAMALRLADRAYVLENGMIVAEGTPEEFSGNDAIKRAYLG